MAPGLWMQRLTTKEPDDKMVECAIKALNLVIEKEENPIIEKEDTVNNKEQDTV